MTYSYNQLAQWDKQYVWHPFTQMKDWLEEEIIIVARGEGVKLYDTEGREYYDAFSSIWVNIHGHNVKELNDAIIDQLGKIAHSSYLGYGNIPATLLARELVEIAPPGLVKVFYSDNGSTAVEVAVKMAFHYWRQCPNPRPEKNKFLTLINAYHGDTIGAVSVGGIDLFHGTYRDLLFPTIKVAAPYCYRCPFGAKAGLCEKECEQALEKAFAEHAHELAGCVIEPVIQGAAGMITQPPGYVKKVRELCDRYDVLMICDEVATGFGRTGALWAVNHDGVSPDLMAISKGLTGGYMPLAVTLATQKIYDAFYGDYAEMKTFFHGHSYTGNQLGCAVALASLELLKKHNLVTEAARKAGVVKKVLAEFNELPHVGDIRQAGLMVGIELVRDKLTKEPYDWQEKMGIKTCLAARKKGLITRPLGNNIVFMPPLVSNDEQLQEMLEIIKASIIQVTEG